METILPIPFSSVNLLLIFRPPYVEIAYQLVFLVRWYSKLFLEKINCLWQFQ